MYIPVKQQYNQKNTISDIFSSLSSLSSLLFFQQYNQANRIALQNKQLNVMTSVQIMLGSPPQNIIALLDTGSGEMFVIGPNCPTCQKDKYINQFVPYNSTQSTTFTNTKQNKTFYYSSARVTGFIGEDMIKFGSLSVETKFLLVNDVEIMGGFGLVNALIGLSINKRLQNILDIGYKQGKLISSNFAFQLTNPDLKQKPYFYYNISNNNFPQAYYKHVYRTQAWSIIISQISINQLKYIQQQQALIDTGSSTILLKPSLYRKIYLQYFINYCYQKSKNIVLLCQCNHVQKYPIIHIKITSSFQILLHPQDYLQGFYNQPNYCKLLFLPSEGQIILGIPFLQKSITIFNKQKNQIGFVKKQLIIHKYINNRNILFIFQLLTYTLVLIFIINLIKICRNKIKNHLRQQLLQTHIQNHIQNHIQTHLQKIQSIKQSSGHECQLKLSEIGNNKNQVQLQTIIV